MIDLGDRVKCINFQGSASNDFVVLFLFYLGAIYIYINIYV